MDHADFCLHSDPFNMLTHTRRHTEEPLILCLRHMHRPEDLFYDSALGAIHTERIFVVKMTQASATEKNLQGLEMRF